MSLPMSTVAEEAARLFSLYSSQALSYATIMSVVQRVANEAYERGVKDATKPLADMSAEVDIRMARLAAQSAGDGGYDLRT